MSITAQDICRQAMMDAMLLGAGQPIDGHQAPDVLAKLNRILDNWNCDERAVYAEIENHAVLTPSLSPHLVGPAGSGGGFIISQRPESVESVAIVDTTQTPNVSIPTRLRDFQWYARQPVPGTTSTIAVDVYYEPDWPNGKFWLWPVPTIAYTLSWWSRTVLAQLALTDVFSLPPGYQDAITLTLAEDLCPMYEQDVPPSLERKATAARARVFGQNAFTPKLATADYGMNTGNDGPSFLWRTGMYTR